MNRFAWLLSLALLGPGAVNAVDQGEIRNIIETAYPGAEIDEIDNAPYQGSRIYEVDFIYEGQKFEALVSPDGEIIKVGLDD